MKISKMSQENKDKGRSVLDVLPGFTQEKLNEIARKAHDRLMSFVDEEGAVTNGEIAKVLLTFEDREELIAAATYLVTFTMERMQATQNPFAAIMEVILSSSPKGDA